MKRTPILRKTPLKARRQFAAMTAIRKGLTVSGLPKGKKSHPECPKAEKTKPKLHQSRSTGKPTKAQVARWDAMRSKGCVACHLNGVDHGLARASYGQGLEIHHLLSGGVRRGHDETVCLCHHHHQAKFLTFPDKGYREHARIYGPSLEREPRRFRNMYGTDDELLAYQNLMLERADVPTFAQAGDA